MLLITVASSSKEKHNEVDKNQRHHLGRSWFVSLFHNFKFSNWFLPPFKKKSRSPENIPVWRVDEQSSRSASESRPAALYQSFEQPEMFSIRELSPAEHSHSPICSRLWLIFPLCSQILPSWFLQGSCGCSAQHFELAESKKSITPVFLRQHRPPLSTLLMKY